MRVRSLSLVLVVVCPFVASQQETHRAAKPLPQARTVSRQTATYERLSPEGFQELFDAGTKPSIATCKAWIRAATSVSNNTFDQLAVDLYEEVPERLQGCVRDYPALPAPDLRKAAQAIYRFDQADENLFAASAADKKKQLAAQQGQLDSAKASLTEVVGKYNKLASDYDQLNQANGQLFRTAQTLKLSVQQAQMDCVSATSQAYVNGITAARKLDQYTPLPQPTVCRTELVGWTLVTKCQ